MTFHVLLFQEHHKHLTHFSYWWAFPSNQEALKAVPNSPPIRCIQITDFNVTYMPCSMIPCLFFSFMFSIRHDSSTNFYHSCHSFSLDTKPLTDLVSCRTEPVDLDSIHNSIMNSHFRTMNYTLQVKMYTTDVSQEWLLYAILSQTEYNVH